MPPPQLARDAPVAYVLQPIEVDLGEALRDDLDVSTPDSLHRRLSQRLHPDEPLSGNHRFDDLPAPLAARDLHRVGLGLDHQAGGLHVLPQPAAAFEPIQPGVGTGVFIHGCVRVEHADDRQAVALADLVVGRIVAGRDLERAGGEGWVDQCVMDHRDRPIEDRHQHRLTDQVTIALVVGVHGHGGVAQNGLRPGRRHGDDLARSLDRIAEVVQRALLFAVLHLQVADRGAQTRRPIDQVRTAVDQPLVVQSDEGLAHGARESGVEREALTPPIARRPQAAQLLRDDAAVLLLPLPHALLEGLAPDRLTRQPVFRQRLLDLQLGGDAGVVAPRHPQHRMALHPLIADHQILDGHEHGVAQVQLTGDIRRRDGDDEGRLRRVGPRPEVAARLPPRVQALLNPAEIVSFGQTGCVHVPHLPALGGAAPGETQKPSRP